MYVSIGEKIKLTDGRLPTRSTILCGHLQKSVRVDFKSCDELSLTTGHGRDAVELELAQKSVVTALCPLSLITRFLKSDAVIRVRVRH